MPSSDCRYFNISETIDIRLVFGLLDIITNVHRIGFRLKVRIYDFFLNYYTLTIGRVVIMWLIVVGILLSFNLCNISFVWSVLTKCLWLVASIRCSICTFTIVATRDNYLL